MDVFLVPTGTAANSLCLSAMTPPWGNIYCHPASHINNDECGAPEFFSNGAKLMTGAARLPDPERHTFFRSVGLGLEDIAIANELYQLHRKNN
ncbi:beta-eliminating lyase family protein [Pseudomonas fluorescens]|uniref:Beta-eliminating lyase family protein n=1 Tax=Pseudomonas fluorescens TaxID=294 RepID=A0A0P8WLC8_PSEFL|nr:beta-eliminating lyase-related protein [Pseudomonas fluorescens]KPU53917.1 beta-eliminating lyase family protein [Pseudomonas fluorescens]